MTNPPTSSDFDNVREQHVLDKAKALLRKMKKHSEFDLVEELVKLLAVSPGIPAVFARMLGEDDFQDPFPIAAILSTFCYNKYFYRKQRVTNAEKIISELWDLIQNPGIATSRKILAVDILESTGYPINEMITQHIPEYRQETWRLAEVPHKKVSDLRRGFFDTLRTLSLHDGNKDDASDRSEADVLDLFGIPMTEENQLEAIYAGSVFACCADMGVLDKHAKGYLSALEKMKTPRSAWCLDILAEWPMPEAFRDKARAAAASLVSNGVKAEAPRVRGVYSHAILTACDGMGWRSLTFFWKISGHRMDALTLELNDAIGIGEISYLPDHGAVLENEYKLNSRLSHILVEPAFAGECVADAMARHLALRTSPPWKLLPSLPHMAGCGMRSAARTPNLDSYTPENILCTPESLENSAALANTPRYGRFIPDPDATYHFCRKFKSKHGFSLSSKAFERFVREVAFRDRENLLHRMALNLEFESLAGRSHSRENALAAHTWLAIRDDTVPFWEIPFVRELSRKAVEDALEEIRDDYVCRQELIEDAQSEGLGYFEYASALMDEHGWLDVPPDERILLADDFMDALEESTPAPKAPVQSHQKKNPRKPKPCPGKRRRRK